MKQNISLAAANLMDEYNDMLHDAYLKTARKDKEAEFRCLIGHCNGILTAIDYLVEGINLDTRVCFEKDGVEYYRVESITIDGEEIFSN